jgi:hypothetical protein
VARCVASGQDYEGGRSVTIRAELYQIPLFIRDSVIKPGICIASIESRSRSRKETRFGETRCGVKEWFERNKE